MERERERGGKKKIKKIKKMRFVRERKVKVIWRMENRRDLMFFVSFEVFVCRSFEVFEVLKLGFWLWKIGIVYEFWYICWGCGLELSGVMN